MFSLVHCPDFFVQCERIFRPELKDKILVISSNQSSEDSRVIACSPQARALGFMPGDRCCDLAELIRHHSVILSEPNYELYADLSARFIRSLTLLNPTTSAYAYDCCFVKLNRIEADSLVKTLKQWLGLSFVVALAPNQTLTGLACHAAQQFDEYQSVVDLCHHQERKALLSRISITDIHGINKITAAQLNKINIGTALELSETSKARIRRYTSPMVEQIAIELAGLRDSELEIGVGISEPVSTIVNTVDGCSLADLKIALKTMLNDAVGRLQTAQAACKSITVCAHISPLNACAPSYQHTLSTSLSKPNSSSNAIQTLAFGLLERLWNESYHYVALQLKLEGLPVAETKQLGLFAEQPRPYKNLGSAIPVVLETRFRSQACDTQRIRRPSSSLAPTTRWSDVLRVS